MRDTGVLRAAFDGVTGVVMDLSAPLMDAVGLGPIARYFFKSELFYALTVFGLLWNTLLQILVYFNQRADTAVEASCTVGIYL